MKPEISIIVPIYNTEKYLTKAINSLRNQTFKNIEIILVNDGSTDNSEEICNAFVKLDNRIKLINQKNSGQGAARNKGLKFANGDYIAFIDSDDYIEVNMYEEMIKVIKKEKADIVACQVNMVDEYGNVISSKINKNEHGNCETGLQAIKRYLKFGRWGTCDKLYERKVLENVSFLEGRTCGEDHAVIISILKNSNKLITIDSYFYNYLVRDNSTTTAEFSKKNFDEMYVWEYVLDEANNMDYEIKEYSKMRLYSCYLDLVNSAIDSNCEAYKKELDLIAEKIKYLIKDILSNQYLLRRYKLGAYLISKNLNLYKFTLKLQRNFKSRG